MSLSRSLYRQSYNGSPSFLVRDANKLGGSNACTTLLNLAHKMASLIMAHGFDTEKDYPSSEEDDD